MGKEALFGRGKFKEINKMTETVEKCLECNGSGTKYLYTEKVEGKFAQMVCPLCYGKRYVVVDSEKLVRI